jgi:hypothetical protein
VPAIVFREPGRVLGLAAGVRRVWVEADDLHIRRGAGGRARTAVTKMALRYQKYGCPSLPSQLQSHKQAITWSRGHHNRVHMIRNALCWPHDYAGSDRRESHGQREQAAQTRRLRLAMPPVRR